MSVIKIFGAFFILLGGFLVYAILGTFFNVISGKKIQAKIVAVEKVESKRFTYLYYPIFEFSYKNCIVRQVNRSQSIDLKEIGTKTDIYYIENHQISRGFTIVEIIFSVVGICFIFFGMVTLFKQR
ncbi:hypothetical protein [Chryseobacterium shigense]|uniref:DUF3592 domain-containing protein n=1 Tax=Chryseobacterium shigense TaxID=297244 RepID=A0A841N5S3_9FLAO|nr:hypothetical protein [Chryseobacterium shigense]MBB6370071.1 hypothetical protein [Chryseobacterium shigense]